MPIIGDGPPKPHGAYIQWQEKGSPIVNSLAFDACTNENQLLESEATQHPVEQGADISDHVRQKLDSVKLELVVSNTPVYDVNQRGSSVLPVVLDEPHFQAPFDFTPGAVFRTIGNSVASLISSDPQPSSANVLQFLATFDAIADTKITLENLQRAAQLFTIVLSSAIYENMHLETLEVDRTPKSGASAVFHLEFREIQTVSVSVVNAPVPTELRGQTRKSLGKKPTTPDPAEPTKKKSAAKWLLNKALGKP